MMSYSGNAIDSLVSSQSSPTTEWMAPVMPWKKPAVHDVSLAATLLSEMFTNPAYG